MLHIIPSLAVLYVVKYRILTLRVQPWLGLLLYFLVVAALLPYLYCCIFVPWDRVWGLNPMADWIGGPIAAFTVPTVFFLYDTLAHKRPSLEFYAIRSLVEIVVLVPLWDVVWTVFMLFVFEWIAI